MQYRTVLIIFPLVTHTIMVTYLILYLAKYCTVDSMGQITKSVCVRQSVCEHSHGHIS